MKLHWHHNLIFNGGVFLLDSIDLNNIPLFVDNSSVELSDTNLIYGKNGTGKSTMVKAISHQINDAEHCIIFDGMERFIRPDKKLNAILLGTQNLEIEKNINDLVTLRGKLQAQLNVAKKAYDTHQGSFNDSIQRYQDFVWDNVYRHFQHNFPKDLRGWGGSKKSFTEKLKQLGTKELIEPSSLQSESEILSKRNLIKSGTKLAIFDDYTPKLNIERLTKLMTNTLSNTATGELSRQIKTRKLESWVQQGKPYLSPDKPCPFCGQNITQDHYKFLENEFSEIINSTYQKFQEDIKNEVEEIQQAQNQLQVWQEDTETLSSENGDGFKASVTKEVVTVNTTLKLLATTVISKKDNAQQSIPIDDSLDSLKLALEQLASKIKDVNERISENNRLVENSVKSEKELHNQILELMRIRCLKPDVQACQSEVRSFQSQLKASSEEKEDKQKEIAKLDYKIAKLRSQTQSEEEAVTRINHLLGLLGNRQFKLVCPTVNQGVSGYYTIEGKNGIQRSVLELSTGEKNLIAFLYFFYLVEARISDAEPVVIVIDDPVTSNDDQSMFLIITLIQNLLFQAKNINADGNRKLQIIVLTHNSSFYINLKEWTGNPYTKKNHSFHLFATPHGSIIKKISNKKEDIINNYDELWQEAKFSFDANQKQTLWNQIRRILETYIKFNNYSESLEHTIRDNIISAEDTEKKLIALQLVKIAHVNSHSIDDLMQDLSPWSKEQIRDAFKFVMNILGGGEHFDSHWNETGN